MMGTNPTIRRDMWQLSIELDDVSELAVDGAVHYGGE